MAASPSFTSPNESSPPRPPARRSLQEPVLSSAEVELDTASHDTGASYIGMEEGAPPSAAPSRWWADTQAQLGRYVSEQPGKAALMALGAGALAALLLGQRMRGRRRRD